VTGYADRYMLAIAGYGDSLGQYGYSSASWSSLPTGVGTQYAGTLSAWSGVGSQSWRIGETIGADGGASASLLWGANTAAVAKRQIALWLDTSGEPLRTTGPISSTQTVITLSGEIDGASAGDLLHVAGEAWIYVSHSGADVTVTRGALGTEAAPLPYSGLGLSVLSEPASVVGRPVTVWRRDGSGPIDAIYHGVVQSLAAGQELALGLGSQGAACLRRRHDPQEARGLALPASIVDGTLDVTSAEYVDARAWGVDPGDVYVWCVTGDGLELLVEASVTASGRLLLSSDPLRVAWRDDAPVQASDVPRSVQIESVRLATCLDADSPGELLKSIVSGLSPSSLWGGLPSARLSGSSIVDVASGLDVLRSESSSGAVWYLPPSARAESVADVVELLCRPVGVSVVPSRDGGLVVVDAYSLSASPGSIVEADVRGAAPSEWTLSESLAIRTATIESDGRVDRIVSSVAQQTARGAQDVKIDASAWGARQSVCVDRWLSALARYEISPVVVRLSVDRASDLDAGDQVLVTLSSLLSADGTRGVSDVLAVVTDASTGALERNLTIALTHREFDVGRWAPTAVVTSVEMDGSLKIDGSDYGTEGTDYAVGAGVKLVELDGTEVDTGVVDNSTSDSVTVTWVGSPAPANRLIVLDGWDDRGVTGPWAWLADSLGELGAGGDPPYQWS